MKVLSKSIACTLLLCALSLVATQYAAAEALRVVSRRTEGIVRSIDYANRIAIISGYKYSFGAPGTNYYPEVKMVDSDFGSFELLRPDMKVYVEYGEFGFIRVVVSLQQLPDDAIIRLH